MVFFKDNFLGGKAACKHEIFYVSAYNIEEAKQKVEPFLITSIDEFDEYGGIYSIQEYNTLREATASERGCGYDSIKRRWYEKRSNTNKKGHVLLKNYLNGDCKNRNFMIIGKKFQHVAK